MLTGFGAYGTEPGIAPTPPQQLPQTGPVGALGPTVVSEESPQVCERSPLVPGTVSQVYCLSTEAHLKKEKLIYLGVGIVGGVALGALVGYMVG